MVGRIDVIGKYPVYRGLQRLRDELRFLLSRERPAAAIDGCPPVLGHVLDPCRRERPFRLKPDTTYGARLQVILVTAALLWMLSPYDRQA